MSITLNGSALGTQQIRSLAKTDSWQSPSEYVDPTTGKVYRAETLGELLEQLDEAGVPLFDNEEMRRRGLTTPGGKAPGGDDDSQWERLLIDLSAYQNPERAREIILDALRNPQATATKNQGQGRVADYHMRGKRAVIAHEIHHDDERGPHFMAQVHTTALDQAGNGVTPKFSFTRGEFRQAILRDINQRLAEEGMSGLVFRIRDETGAKVAERKAQLNAEESDEYKAAAEKGELPPLLDEDSADEVAEQLPLSTRKETLRKAAQEVGAEAANLYAQAQALQKQNAIYRGALRALEKEESLVARIGHLENQVQAIQQQAAEAEAANAATIAEQATLVAQAVEHAERTTFELETTQQQAAKLSEALDDTKAKLVEAEGELSTASEQVEQLENRLESTGKTLASVEQERNDYRDQAAGLDKELNAERQARAQDQQAHATTVEKLRGELVDVKQQAEADLATVRGELKAEQAARQASAQELEKVSAALASEKQARSNAERDLDGTKRQLSQAIEQGKTQFEAREKAEAANASLREELAALKAQQAAQAQQLASEQAARAQAEQAARDALAGKATAEAQRDARPTPEAMAEVQAALAKTQGQRDELRERLERLLANAPAPGNNGPSGNTPGA